MRILILSLLLTGCITTSVNNEPEPKRYYSCNPTMKKMLPSVAQNCFETLIKRDKDYDADEITKACFGYALKAVCSPCIEGCF